MDFSLKKPKTQLLKFKKVPFSEFLTIFSAEPSLSQLSIDFLIWSSHMKRQSLQALSVCGSQIRGIQSEKRRLFNRKELKRLVSNRRGTEGFLKPCKASQMES